MKALWNDTVIAEAPQEDLIKIEGNWYFPPSAVKRELLSDGTMHTTCFWKGEASYYTITAGDKTFENGAWYYPEPLAGSIERVKKDFTNYVAFWPQVTVTE